MSATASSLAELFPNSTSADNGQSTLMFDPRKPGAVNPFATDTYDVTSQKSAAVANDDLASLAAGAGSNFGSIPLDAALATLIRKRVLSDSQMMDFTVSESIKALVFHMLMGSSSTSDSSNKSSNQPQRDVVPLVAAALADRCCPAVGEGDQRDYKEGALDAYSADVMAYFTVHMMTLDDPKITKEWIGQLKVLWTVGLSPSSEGLSWPAQAGMTRGGPNHLKDIHMQHQLGACVLLTSFLNLLPSLVNFVPNAATLGIASLIRALLSETVPLLVKIAKGEDTITYSGTGCNKFDDTAEPKPLTVLQLAAMEACLSCLKKLYSTAAEALSEEARSTFNLKGPGEGFNRLFSSQSATWEGQRAKNSSQQHPLDDATVWNATSWLSPIGVIVRAFLNRPYPSSANAGEGDGGHQQQGRHLMAMLSNVESKVGGLVLVDTLNEERAMLMSRHRSEIIGSDQYHHTDVLLCALTQRVAISVVHIASGVLSAMEATLDDLEVVNDESADDEEDSEKPHQRQNGMTAFSKAVQAANTCSQDALLLLADAQLLFVTNVKVWMSSMGSNRSLNASFMGQLQERLEHGFTPSQGHAHIRRTTAGTGVLVYLLQHVIFLSQFINTSPPSSNNGVGSGSYNWLMLNSLVLQRGSDDKCGALFSSRAASAVKECVLAVMVADGEVRGPTCAFTIPPPEASTFISSMFTMLSTNATCPATLQQQGDQKPTHPALVVIAQVIATLVHSPHTNHLTTAALANIITQSLSTNDTTTIKSDSGGLVRVKILISEVLNVLAQKMVILGGCSDGGERNEDNCTSFKDFKEKVLDTADASSWNALTVAIYKNILSHPQSATLKALNTSLSLSATTKKALFGALCGTAVSVISPQQLPTSRQLAVIVESTQVLETLFSAKLMPSASLPIHEATKYTSTATWYVLSTAWDLLFTSNEDGSSVIGKNSPMGRSHNKYAFRTPGDVALSFIPPTSATTADILASTSGAPSSALTSQSSAILDLLTRLTTSTTVPSSSSSITAATAKWVVQKALSCVTVPNTTADNSSFGDNNKPVGMALWIPIGNGLQRWLVAGVDGAKTFLRALCIEIGIAVEKQWNSPKCDENEIDVWNLGMCAPLLCIRNVTLNALSDCHIMNQSENEASMITLPRLLLKIALSKWELLPSAAQGDNNTHNNNRAAVSADVRKLCGETLSRFPLSVWVEESGWMGELTETMTAMGLQPSEQQLPLVEKLLSLCFILCSHLSTVASQSSVDSDISGLSMSSIAALLTPLLESLSRNAQKQQSAVPHVLLQHLLFAVRDSMCFILLVRFNTRETGDITSMWSVVDANDTVNANFIFFLQTRLASVEKQHKDGGTNEMASSSLLSITTALGRWATAVITGGEIHQTNIGTALLAALDDNPPTYCKLPLFVGCLVFIAKLKVLRVELGVDSTGGPIPSVLAPFLRNSSSHNEESSHVVLLQRLAERTNSLQEIEAGNGSAGSQVKLLGQLCVLIDALSE